MRISQAAEVCKEPLSVVICFAALPFSGMMQSEHNSAKGFQCCQPVNHVRQMNLHLLAPGCCHAFPLHCRRVGSTAWLRTGGPPQDRLHHGQERQQRRAARDTDVHCGGRHLYQAVSARPALPATAAFADWSRGVRPSQDLEGQPVNAAVCRSSRVQSRTPSHFNNARMCSCGYSWQ